MTEKEQIIIDGIIINACLVSEKCKEFETCKIKNILRQLARKTTECEELKESVDKIKNYVKNQMFDVDCKNWFDRFIYTFEDWKKSICEANDRYRNALEPFQDEYFKGLDTTTIAELAKKSIRLTTENRNLETALEEIEGMLQVIVESNKVYPLQSNLYKILDIIADLRTDGALASPDSEQIEPACAKHKRRNPVSVEQIQDSKAKGEE